MATESEIRKAKQLHSLTFYVPPRSVLLLQDNDYYNSANLGDASTAKNTWYDWHLAPTSRPVINPAPVRTNFVEIPAASGYLDLTDLFGTNIYGTCEGSFSFLVMNDYGIWYQRKDSIMNYLHGKRLNVVLNDDPTKFYHGRWEVSEWVNNNDGTCSSITFSYHIQPGYGIVPEEFTSQG